MPLEPLARLRPTMKQHGAALETLLANLPQRHYHLPAK